MRHSQVANARRTGLVSRAGCRLAAFGHGWFDSIPAHAILRKGKTMARYAVLKSDMSGIQGHCDHYLIDADGDARLSRIFDAGQSWDTTQTRWPSGLASIATFFVIAALVVVSVTMSWQFNPMRVIAVGVDDLIVGTGLGSLLTGQGYQPSPGRILPGVIGLAALAGIIAAAIFAVRMASGWATMRFAPSIFVFDATEGETAYRRTTILPEQFEQVAGGEVKAGSLADESEVEALRAERQALQTVVDDDESPSVLVGEAIKRIRDIDRQIGTVTL